MACIAVVNVKAFAQQGQEIKIWKRTIRFALVSLYGCFEIQHKADTTTITLGVFYRKSCSGLRKRNGGSSKTLT